MTPTPEPKAQTFEELAYKLIGLVVTNETTGSMAFQEIMKAHQSEIEELKEQLRFPKTVTIELPEGLAAFAKKYVQELESELTQTREELRRTENMIGYLKEECKDWKSRAMASPCKCTDYEIAAGHLEGVCEYGNVLRERDALQEIRRLESTVTKDKIINALRRYQRRECGLENWPHSTVYNLECAILIVSELYSSERQAKENQ